MSEADSPSADDGNGESSSFISALVTEQFVLQSAASSTIAESGTRASIYLAALSSGMVAIGFSSDSPATLAALAGTVLPTIFVLGWFTLVRLVDTSISNIVAQNRMEQIRRYYATLQSSRLSFFEEDGNRETGTLGVRYSSWSLLFTTGSMIAVVNSVVGGAAVGLIATASGALSTPAALSAGVLTGALALALALLYQHRRLAHLLRPAADNGNRPSTRFARLPGDEIGDE